MSDTLHADVVPAAAIGAERSAVLVHGFMGDVDDWDVVSDALSTRGFRTVRVALPGHGLSGAALERVVRGPTLDSVVASSDTVGNLLTERRVSDRATVGPVPDFSTAASRFGAEPSADALPMARAAALLLRTVRRHRRPDEAVVLVGYSLGGRMCAELAADPAALLAAGVGALVLVSAAPGGLADPDARRERRRLDAERAVAIRADFASFLRSWYRSPLFASSERAALDAIVARRLRHDPTAMATAIEAFSPGRQVPRIDALRALSGEMPVHWVGGRRDAAYMAVAEQLRVACPAVRQTRVAAAGHHVHVDRPMALVSTIGAVGLALDAAGSA